MLSRRLRISVAVAIAVIHAGCLPPGATILRERPGDITKPFVRSGGDLHYAVQAIDTAALADSLQADSVVRTKLRLSDGPTLSGHRAVLVDADSPRDRVRLDDGESVDLRSVERITLYRRKPLAERAGTTFLFVIPGFLHGLTYALVEEGFNWKYLVGATAVTSSAGALWLLDTESPRKPILVQYEVAF